MRPGTPDGCEGRGAASARLLLRPFRNRSAVTRMSLRDRRATIKVQQVTTQPSTTQQSISIRRCAMADLVFVLLTIGLFALLALVVRAVERL